ncbi:hypothetical protein [Leeuwenhoekiella parthenopeia]|nr:hypothetical protein [Leeuwenhoekiella parthenopeia]
MKANDFHYASYQRGSKDGRKLGIAVGVLIATAVMIVLLAILYYK